MLAVLMAVLQAATPSTSHAQAAEQPSQGVERVGTAHDPAGDTHFFFGEVPAPDLRSATVRLSSSKGMSVAARFTAATFSSKTTAVHFSFYMQQPEDPASCADYLVNFNVAGTRQGEVSVQRRNAGGAYKSVGSGTARVAVNGLQMTVPAEVFGGDLGKLAYWHVVVAVRLRDEAESRLLDYLPDTNLPLATIR